jgi:hypothetical protein
MTSICSLILDVSVMVSLRKRCEVNASGDRPFRQALAGASRDDG